MVLIYRLEAVLPPLPFWLVRIITCMNLFFVRTFILAYLILTRHYSKMEKLISLIDEVGDRETISFCVPALPCSQTFSQPQHLQQIDHICHEQQFQ